MNDQLGNLLIIRQENDYTWTALLPEMVMMWVTGHSESEARANWLREYGGLVSLMLDSLLQERAKHPVNVELSPPIQRPTTVEFPYRGKLYRIATNEGLPKRHIVLPDGKILAVCGWTGRVPSTLADVRRSSDPPAISAMQLNGVLAEEIPLLPGQTTHPMASEPRDLRIRFTVQGERFVLSHEAYEHRKRTVFVPNYGFYRIGIYLESMPIKLGGLSPLPSDDYDPADVAVALPYAEAVDVRPRATLSSEEEVNHAD